MAKNKTLKLVSWNVNGIRAVAKKGWSEWIAANDYDVIGVQETKAQVDQLEPELLKPSGYQESKFFSAERKGYSGTATFYKTDVSEIKSGFDIEVFDPNNLPPKITNASIGKKETTINYEGIKDPIGPENQNLVLTEEGAKKLKLKELEEQVAAFNAEGRLIESRLPYKDSELILFTIYFPNGGQGEERIKFKLEFYEALLRYVAELEKTHPYIVISGDLNTAHHDIDLARPKANLNTTGFMPIERVYLDKLEALGFRDSYRVHNPDKPDIYTWWSYRAGARERNVGWRIDYFYISKALVPHLAKAETHTGVMGSDHCPISVELAL